LHDALAAGKPVPVNPRSIADGLGAPFAGDRGFEISRELVESVVLITEEEIEEGTRFLYARAKLACEPAGAATTGALLAGKIPLQAGETVVAVVSGGNVATQTAAAILGGQ
jgi:threonine dehydratase